MDTENESLGWTCAGPSFFSPGPVPVPVTTFFNGPGHSPGESVPVRVPVPVPVIFFQWSRCGNFFPVVPVPVQREIFQNLFALNLKKLLNIQFLINLVAECQFFWSFVSNFTSIDVIYTIFH